MWNFLLDYIYLDNFSYLLLSRLHAVLESKYSEYFIIREMLNISSDNQSTYTDNKLHGLPEIVTKVIFLLSIFTFTQVFFKVLLTSQETGFYLCFSSLIFCKSSQSLAFLAVWKSESTFQHQKSNSVSGLMCLQDGSGSFNEAGGSEYFPHRLSDYKNMGRSLNLFDACTKKAGMASSREVLFL